MIGRGRNCHICFKEGNLSREQCRIDFIDDKWILKDGDGQKSSTNGTWLFASEDEKIYDGMIFKAGSSLFKIELVYD
jgi:pSer/pThr/pTyr-binding forkhead associated (FHA) protein